MSITSHHFGIHAVARIHVPDEGGAFERFLDQIPFTSLRYPGGTPTESDALAGELTAIFGDPGTPGDPDRLVTVREIQDFADERDLVIQAVIPVRQLFTDGEPGSREVKLELIDGDIQNVTSLMDRIGQIVSGEHGPMRVEHFAIGNEWWNVGFERSMTAQEYGMVVNAILDRLPDILAENYSGTDLPMPKIAVQAGVGWHAGSNEEILSQISLENRAEIDTVVTHFYPATLESVQSRGLLFQMMRDFGEAEGMDSPDYLVSEWNIHAVVDGDRGMLQSSALLGAFDFMIENGVTDANFWGGNYRFLETRLAEVSHNPWEGVAPEDIVLTLTPAGHVMRIMARELPGTDLGAHGVEDILTEGEADGLVLNSYISDDKTVMFLSSRVGEERTVTLDLEALGITDSHVWVRVLEAVDNPSTVRDESEFDSHHARAQYTVHSQSALADDPEIVIPPGGIVSIISTHNQALAGC